MYRVVVYPEALEQISALPDEALADCAEVLSALEVAPWNGAPHHQANPGGAVRRWLFGPAKAGQIVYLVLDDQREVHLLLIQWLG